MSNTHSRRTSRCPSAGATTPAATEARSSIGKLKPRTCCWSFSKNSRVWCVARRYRDDVIQVGTAPTDECGIAPARVVSLYIAVHGHSRSDQSGPAATGPHRPPCRGRDRKDDDGAEHGDALAQSGGRRPSGTPVRHLPKAAARGFRCQLAGGLFGPPDVPTPPIGRLVLG